MTTNIAYPTHTFTHEDAYNSADPELKVFATIAPEYDDARINGIRTVSRVEDPELIKKKQERDINQFNLDIPRTTGFYLTDKDGRKNNLIKQCKEKYGKDNENYKPNYEDMKFLLVKSYDFNPKQAEHMLEMATQNSMQGSGVAQFGKLVATKSLMEDKDPPLFNVHNNSIMGVTINEQGQVHYNTSIKMPLDSAMLYGNNPPDGFTRTLHNESKDYVICNINVNLGPVGQEFTKPPLVEFQFVGTGDVGTAILEQLKKVKTEQPQLEAKNIIDTYDQFLVNNGLTHKNPGYKEEYNSCLKDKLNKAYNQIYSDIICDGSVSKENAQTLKELKQLPNADRVFDQDERIKSFTEDVVKHAKEGQINGDQLYNCLTECIGAENISENATAKLHKASKDFVKNCKVEAAPEGLIAKFKETVKRILGISKAPISIGKAVENIRKAIGESSTESLNKNSETLRFTKSINGNKSKDILTR